MLSGLRVIKHPFPLFLLGADVLCVCRKAPSWNYEGISLTTNPGKRTVSETVRFRREVEVEEVLLA